MATPTDKHVFMAEDVEAFEYVEAKRKVLIDAMMRRVSSDGRLEGDIEEISLLSKMMTDHTNLHIAKARVRISDRQVAETEVNSALLAEILRRSNHASGIEANPSGTKSRLSHKVPDDILESVSVVEGETLQLEHVDDDKNHVE